MKVFIAPGDTLIVGFLDDEGDPIDGDFSVTFAKDAIRIETDWPDATGRQGVLYEEVFGLRCKLYVKNKEDPDVTCDDLEAALGDLESSIEDLETAFKDEISKVEEACIKTFAVFSSHTLVDRSSTFETLSYEEIRAFINIIENHFALSESHAGLIYKKIKQNATLGEVIDFIETL